MTRKDEVTRVVKILDILVDGTPRILTGEWLCKQGKRVKMFQQMVPVLDAALFERFTTQAHKGDSVQITVATEWREQEYTTYLMDFATITQIPSETVEQMPESVLSLSR